MAQSRSSFELQWRCGIVHEYLVSHCSYEKQMAGLELWNNVLKQKTLRRDLLDLEQRQVELERVI